MSELPQEQKEQKKEQKKSIDPPLSSPSPVDKETKYKHAEEKNLKEELNPLQKDLENWELLFTGYANTIKILEGFSASPIPSNVADLNTISQHIFSSEQVQEYAHSANNPSYYAGYAARKSFLEWLISQHEKHINTLITTIIQHITARTSNKKKLITQLECLRNLIINLPQNSFSLKISGFARQVSIINRQISMHAPESKSSQQSSEAKLSLGGNPEVENWQALVQESENFATKLKEFYNSPDLPPQPEKVTDFKALRQKDLDGYSKELGDQFRRNCQEITTSVIRILSRIDRDSLKEKKEDRRIDPPSSVNQSIWLNQDQIEQLTLLRAFVEKMPATASDCDWYITEINERILSRQTQIEEQASKVSPRTLSQFFPSSPGPQSPPTPISPPPPTNPSTSVDRSPSTTFGGKN